MFRPGFLWAGEIGVPLRQSHSSGDTRAFFSIRRGFLPRTLIRLSCIPVGLSEKFHDRVLD
jgi:hypothetical protein